MNQDNILDYVPVDICVKGMIVAGFKDFKEKSENIPIYNGSSIKLVSLRALKDCKSIHENPPLQAISYLGITFTKCKFIFWVIKILECLIPAMILDVAAKVVGEKPRWIFLYFPCCNFKFIFSRAMKVQRIIYNSETSLSHFTKSQFKFMNLKFLDLHKSIPDDEKEDFFIHEKYNSQNLRIFNSIYHVFMEIFFNQKLSDAERAKKRYKYVVGISRTYQFLAYATFLWICQKFIFYFLNKIY